VECKTYLQRGEQPLAENVIEELDRKCKSPQWGVDVFCEGQYIYEKVSKLHKDGRLANAQVWTVGPPPDDYAVVWAQIAFLHLTRVVLSGSPHWENNSFFVKVLERVEAENEESITEKVAAPNFAKMIDLLGVVEEKHSKSLHIMHDAKRMACEYGGTMYLRQAYKALGDLAEYGRLLQQSVEGAVGQTIGNFLMQRGYDYKASDSAAKRQQLEGMCCGQQLACEEHIRLGIHSECVRIHFKVCPSRARVCIQHCGSHL